MNDTEKLVVEYLKNKAIKEPSGDEKKALQAAESSLTAYYWQNAEKLVKKMIDVGEEGLTQEDLNLIDFGLIDSRLSGKKSIVANIDGELSAEHRQVIDLNCYYLSQWLGIRWNSYNTVQSIISDNLTANDNSKSDDNKGNNEISRLSRLRNDIYAKLKPYLVGVPGLNESIIDSITSGVLDSQLENVSLVCYYEPNLANLNQRNKIATIRRNIIRSLSLRLKKHKFAPLVTALDGIANNIWQERLKISLRDGVKKAVVKKPISKSESESKQLEFLLGEMHIIKSLMPIAGIEGRKYKTSPVLLDFSERVTKESVAEVWQKIGIVDPRLPGNPDILLTPCEGSGFFEWDRDTLLIPIHPTTSVQDNIINGFANYRILMDMQGDRVVKNFYTENFPKANFKTAFIRDYKNWITHVNIGNKGGLSQVVLNFFFKNFGPDVDRVPVPRHLSVMSSIEQQALIKDLVARLKSKTIDPEQCFDLGILYWIHRKFDNAIKLLEMALSNGVQKDRVLVCLGYLNKEKGYFKVAAGHFRRAKEVRGASIWYMLAQRAK